MRLVIAIALPLALAVVPPVLLVGAVARNAVNVPMVDEWVFVGAVEQAWAGRVPLADAWAQHNEHRHVLPKLLMLALAVPSRWDVRWQMAASLLLTGVTLAIVAAMTVTTLRPAAAGAIGLVVLLTSALLSSPTQWQNQIWGWGLGAYVHTVFAVASAWALMRAGIAQGPRARVGWSIASVGTAVAAAYSFAHGLFVLGLVPLALLGLRAGRVPLPATVPLAAAAVGVVAGGAYFVGWVPPRGQPAPVPPWTDPGAATWYALAWLGSPLSGRRVDVGAVWGAVWLGVIVPSAAWLWRDDVAGRRTLVPWLVLAGYAVAAAAVAAVTRIGAGEHTAVLSRYTTFAMLGWLALGPVVVLAIARLVAIEAHGAAAVALAAAAVGLVLAARDGTTAWLLGRDAMMVRSSYARRGLACLRREARPSDACLRTVCWDAAVARPGVARLRALQLGPWAPGQSP